MGGERLFTQFPEPVEKEGVYTPYELYELVHQDLTNPRDDFYCGGPASSGAIRRLVKLKEGQKMTQTQANGVIRANMRLSLAVAARAEDIFNGNKVIIPPHALGLRVGPQEFNMNLFWLLFLSGPKLDFAERFTKLAPTVINTQIFNDHSFSPEKREGVYQQLLELYFAMVDASQAKLNPVRNMAMFPDFQVSLGCRTETRIAKKLKERGFEVATWQACFDKNSSDFASHPAVRRYQQIEQLGGPIFDQPFVLPIVDGPGKELVVLKELEV